MSRLAMLLALTLPTVSAPLAAQAGAARPEIFVVATLYGRHAATPAYGHDTLRAIIDRIAPRVVVLDVSPRELRDQTVHPSKAEYPEVIFPLVRQRGYHAYAGEPDEPRFSEIVSSLSRHLEAFRDTRPELAAIDRAHNDATYAALAAVWDTPAEVNGALTDHLLASRRRYQDRVAGAGVAEAWRLWNDHAAAVVRRAIRENPGERVLVLIGVENAGPLRAALAADPSVDLVDVESWLRTAGRSR